LSKKQDHAPADLNRIIESARRLGVELDEEEAVQWLTTMAAATEGEEYVVVDTKAGVFGHKVSMLDFSTEDLAHFREMGRLVEFDDTPGQVETALALSGSAAQSKVQSYPGDCDFFERVNIIAPSREEACRILANLIREKALNTRSGPNYKLIQVRFGSYPQDVVHGGSAMKAGASLPWTPEEVEAGQVEATDSEGHPVTITWQEVALDPGWCKLDWVIADPKRKRLANASNMLDVTWEAPDGTITPLDGYLDGYFQEIYLDASSVPIFSKLVKHVSPDAMDEYVAQLEHETEKYLKGAPPNYGKAAKRMYNAFRLSGRYEEAAFLRELFDEPAALLYQVWSLIRTVEESAESGADISLDDILAQADDLIMDVIKVLEGAEELEIVRHLLRLEHALCREELGSGLGPGATAARAEVLNIVNNFFYERMTAHPAIKTYIEGMMGK
jgi:hypothetical protein